MEKEEYKKIIDKSEEFLLISTSRKDNKNIAHLQSQGLKPTTIISILMSQVKKITEDQGVEIQCRNCGKFDIIIGTKRAMEGFNKKIIK